MKDINEMSVSEYNTFLEVAKMHQAQEDLKNINISSFSKMAKKSGKKFFNSIKKIAYPKDNEGVSGLEMARKLAEWQTKK